MVVLISVGSRVDAGVKYSSTVLFQNPIAYYRLDETAQTTSVDLVGGNNAAYGTAITLGRIGPRPALFDGFETTNRAVQFDRDNFNSVLSLPTTPRLELGRCLVRARSAGRGLSGHRIKRNIPNGIGDRSFHHWISDRRTAVAVGTGLGQSR